MKRFKPIGGDEDDNEPDAEICLVVAVLLIISSLGLLYFVCA